MKSPEEVLVDEINRCIAEELIHKEFPGATPAEIDEAVALCGINPWWARHFYSLLKAMKEKA